MKKAVLSLLTICLLISPSLLLFSACQAQKGPISPSVAQMELGGETGMAYIIQLSDGRFIIIDGGISREDTRANMLAYLQAKSTAQKPVIACWMFTHLDGDHFDNAYDFLLSYRRRIELQGFAYTFPLKEDFEDLPTDSQEIKDYKASARWICDAQMEKWDKLCALYPDADYWDMQANEKRSFADVNLHILITANERLPENVYSHNLRSATFRMTFTQGTKHTLDDTSFLVLGDCSGQARSEWMIETYGRNILKSDVMQVTTYLPNIFFTKEILVCFIFSRSQFKKLQI